MKLPRSVYNWTSLIGATIAIISLFMIVFLFIVSLLYKESSSYIGLVIYIVLPVFLVIGLIIIPLGMMARIRRERKGLPVKEKRWPVFDFNQARQRNAFTIFAIGTTLFLLLSAMGSYEAFHYTESVKFCGTLCHEVMNPEYTGYLNSPHARVACVDCHVGSGADWYIRSKLSGLYQVYAATFNLYPRPIPTPITSLRPARETCEECHWPQKFYARQLITNTHYLADGNNTEWEINLQMKIGPLESALGLQEGIHWHINPDIRIEYIASTFNRDVIPWVKYTNLKTGEVRVYEDEDNPLQPGQSDTLEVRVMDCMDCHNRPSHGFHSPMEFINDAITAGSIPKELPDIKFLAMQILHRTFSTTDSAMMAIENEVSQYYTDAYPEVAESQKGMILQAITGMQEEFRKNIFPEMNASWRAYPTHISHLETDGCFRCHNDRHASSTGAVISKDCNLCHTIVSQGTQDGQMVYGTINDTMEFIHVNDDSQSWKEALCSECHRDMY